MKIIGEEEQDIQFQEGKSKIQLNLLFGTKADNFKKENNYNNNRHDSPNQIIY